MYMCVCVYVCVCVLACVCVCASACVRELKKGDMYSPGVVFRRTSDLQGRRALFFCLLCI